MLGEMVMLPMIIVGMVDALGGVDVGAALVTSVTATVTPGSIVAYRQNTKMAK
jgi:hypothetical protein